MEIAELDTLPRATLANVMKAIIAKTLRDEDLELSEREYGIFAKTYAQVLRAKKTAQNFSELGKRGADARRVKNSDGITDANNDGDSDGNSTITPTITNTITETPQPLPPQKNENEKKF
ncbi:hypothetical protein AGMMS49975_20780 [Clostridia bacterium]|nr:hypothetical protein AGMMS49975_20780 [Clostridia bacterium]